MHLHLQVYLPKQELVDHIPLFVSLLVENNEKLFKELQRCGFGDEADHDFEEYFVILLFGFHDLKIENGDLQLAPY